MIDAMPMRAFGSGRAGFRWLQGWFSAAVETIAPSVCLECGAFAAKGWSCDACFDSCRLWDETWCTGCGLPVDHGHADFCRFGRLPGRPSKLPRQPWTECRSLGAYDGILRSACLAAKRPENTWLVRPVAREWWTRHESWARGLGRSLLVPIPRHWSRRWATGHDPAAVFARSLEKVWARNAPEAGIRTGMILKRTRATPRLASLDADARAGTMRNAFAVSIPKSLRIQDFDSVVLVDDIATTGATAMAAARALVPAGPKNLVLAVIARTLEGTG